MSEFDAYSDSYTDIVNDSIAFGGADTQYYAVRKAEHLLEVVRRSLGDPSVLKALDVGCGVGVTDQHLVGKFAQLHGVDIAGDAVAVASKSIPNVDYQTYDGTNLPFDDASMDIVFAICVAHHVPKQDRPGFAKELTRVVKPGGIVMLFEHNPMNPLTRLAVSRCEFDEGVELLSRAESTSLLRGAGLETTEARYIIFTPFDRAFMRTIGRGLHAVPLGAQHCVVARKAPS